MVAEVLVAENRIEDGRILLTRLVRGGLEIGVAFWLRLDDRDRWRLFIACPALAGVRRDVAVTQLFEELQKMPFAPFDFNSVRLVSDTTPAPAEAMALRDNTGRGRPVWIKESGQLGEYNYEEAYIYERISAALTRDEVIQNVLHLMERPGLPPSKLIRRDGSTVQGIPVGLVTHSPGTEVLVSIFDPATRTTDTVPAADIVNIE